MRSPVQALAWELWQRHRWGLSALLAYFACLAAFLHIVPAEAVARAVGELALRDALANGHLSLEELTQALGCLAALPLAGGLLYAASAFGYGNSKRVGESGSDYPARSFTLPVSTALLVACPMLLGAVSVAIAATAMERWALWPWGLHSPLAAPPGLLTAAVLLWVQAISWTPFRTAWFKAMSAILILGGIMAVAAAGPEWGLPRGVSSAILFVSLPLAYRVALAGVARARRGDRPDASRVLSWLRARARRRRSVERPFASAAAAQLWFEWRMHGRGLPLLVSCLLPFILALLWFEKDPLTLKIGTLTLLFPSFIATLSASALAEFSHKQTMGVGPFTAIRPATCAELVAAKLKMAALSTVATYALVLTVVPLGILVSGRVGELTDAWHEARNHLPAWKLAGLLGVALVLLLLYTWKHLVENLFAGLTGRAWVANAMVLVGVGLYVVLGSAAGWLYFHPEYHADFIAALPGLLALVVALKVLLGVAAGGLSYQRGLVSPRTLVRLGGLWLAAAVALAALLFALSPGDLGTLRLIVPAAFLSLPLARLSWTPLALAWNRHR